MSRWTLAALRAFLSSVRDGSVDTAGSGTAGTQGKRRIIRVQCTKVRPKLILNVRAVCLPTGSCMQSRTREYDVSLLLPDSRVISCSCTTTLSCVCRLRISVSDFDILARLGDGSFSTVVLAKYKGDGQQYAVKIVNKTLILRNKVLIKLRSAAVDMKGMLRGLAFLMQLARGPDVVATSRAHWHLPGSFLQQQHAPSQASADSHVAVPPLIFSCFAVHFLVP